MQIHEHIEAMKTTRTWSLFLWLVFAAVGLRSQPVLVSDGTWKVATEFADGL
jgi:hypothetical protein